MTPIRTSRSRIWALLVLLLIEFIGLRPHLLVTGYHLDDWYEVALTTCGPSYHDGVRGFADSGIYWDRPANMLLLPFAHRLMGVSPGAPMPKRPWVPQLLLALFEVVEGWLLFLLLERLVRRPGLALAIAGIALLFPNRGGFHYRPGLLSHHLSQVLMLASMLWHLGWRETGRWGKLAVGQGCYALGLLCFETPMLTPLLLAGALTGRTWAESRDLRRAVSEGVRCFAPYAAVLAAALLWKTVGVGMIPGGVSQKASKVVFSAANSVKVFIAGFGCATLWPLSLSAARLRDAVRELGWLWLVLPIFVGWAALQLGARRGSEPAPDRTCRWVLAGAVVGGFFGTYGPFFISAHHMPYVNGILSRVNAAGAWVGGMWLAALLNALPRRWKVPALVLLLAGFTWTNWVESRAWARAWSLQKEILSALVPQARAIPGASVVLLKGTPTTIHGAHVFDSDYDLGNALRMSTGHRELMANALAPNMKVQGDALIQSYSGEVVNRYPFSSLYVYDHAARKLVPAVDADLTPPPPEVRSVLFKLLFGPGMRP